MSKLVRRVRKKSSFRNRGSERISSAIKQKSSHNRLSGRAAKK